MLRDENYTTPSGPLDSDESIASIQDDLLRLREFGKKYGHPDVHVIYSFEDLPRRNLEFYYYQRLQEAMAKRIPKIIVEPSTLGVKLGQYINIGYYLHWFCIGTGLLSLFFGVTFRHKTYTIYSLSFLSVLLLHASNLYYRNLDLAYYQYLEHSKVQGFLDRSSPKVSLVTDCPIILIPYNPLRRRLWHHLVGCAAGVLTLSLIWRGLPQMLCRCPDGVVPAILRHEGNLFEFYSLLPLAILSKVVYNYNQWFMTVISMSVIFMTLTIWMTWMLTSDYSFCPICIPRVGLHMVVMGILDVLITLSSFYFREL